MATNKEFSATSRKRTASAIATAVPLADDDALTVIRATIKGLHETGTPKRSITMKTVEIVQQFEKDLAEAYAMIMLRDMVLEGKCLITGLDDGEITYLPC